MSIQDKLSKLCKDVETALKDKHPSVSVGLSQSPNDRLQGGCTVTITTNTTHNEYFVYDLQNNPKFIANILEGQYYV